MKNMSTPGLTPQEWDLYKADAERMALYANFSWGTAALLGAAGVVLVVVDF